MAEMILKKERNSNLELYRIIVMLLIVAHHYVVNSGLTDVMKENPYSADSIFLLLVWYVGKNRHQLFCIDYGIFYVPVTDYHS